MGEAPRVLLTGATGRIGRAIIPLLAEAGGYRLRSGHRRTDASDLPADLPDPVYCELTDYDSLRAACEGVDTVVHLAADANVRPFVESMLGNNIIGPYHLCEAALAAGCRRIVFASTCHVVWNYWRLDRQRVDEDVLSRPDSIYGVTKAYGEDLGRYYVECRGLPSFIALRIGAFQPDEVAAQRTNTSFFHLWLSVRDGVQIIRRAIEAPPAVRFAVFHAVSDNDRKMMRIDRAREILGYQPEDNSERHLEGRDVVLEDWLRRWED